MKQTRIDSGYPIVPRTNVDFGLDGDIPKYWFGGDAFRTRFFDAMSTVFPEGEKFFIHCVRHYRDQITDPALAAQVGDFMRQEAQHGRVHREFNDRLRSQGIDIDRIEANTRRLLGRSRRRLPAWFTLAQTSAAEHLTSILAHGMFEQPRILASADPRIRALFLWHGVEEIEHKAVAFDVLTNVAGVGYLKRCGAMLYTSVSFPAHVLLITRQLLEADGFRGRAQLKLWRDGLRWLFGRDGVFRALGGHYRAYFRPDFHPWQDGDMAVYEQWRDAFDSTGGDALAAGDAAQALAA